MSIEKTKSMPSCFVLTPLLRGTDSCAVPVHVIQSLQPEGYYTEMSTHDCMVTGAAGLTRAQEARS